MLHRMIRCGRRGVCTVGALADIGIPRGGRYFEKRNDKSKSPSTIDFTPHAQVPLQRMNIVLGCSDLLALVIGQQRFGKDCGEV
jgi:hypothetical protein